MGALGVCSLWPTYTWHAERKSWSSIEKKKRERNKRAGGGGRRAGGRAGSVEHGCASPRCLSLCLPEEASRLFLGLSFLGLRRRTRQRQPLLALLAWVQSCGCQRQPSPPSQSYVNVRPGQHRTDRRTREGSSHAIKRSEMMGERVG